MRQFAVRVIKTWIRLRRLIGIITLLAGLWSIWKFLNIITGGSIRIGTWFALTALGQPEFWVVTTWFLVSILGLVGMILNIRRVPLSGIAAGWNLFLTTYWLFSSRVQPESYIMYGVIYGRVTAESVVESGIVRLDMFNPLLFGWITTNILDFLLSWLGPKWFGETK